MNADRNQVGRLSLSTLRRIVVVAMMAVALPVVAQDADLWPLWEAHDPESTRTIDHSAWNEFLAEYLITDDPSGVNLVRYADVTSDDRRSLAAYIEFLESISIHEHNREVQFAYWVNLYNSYTVKLILDHYPVNSIRDINISPGLFNRGPWDAEVLTIEGVDITLNDIEHRILRPIWKDPRIHYVINCASIGCPNLLPQALEGSSIESTMSVAAHEYVNHPRAVSFSRNRLTLSSIYDWFIEDFSGSVESTIDHLIVHADPELATRLRQFDGRVRYAYDWSLNEP